MDYFVKKVPVYQTRGVAAEVSPVVISILSAMVEKMQQSGVPADYLQVFRLSEKDGMQVICHTQEEPEYRKEITLPMPFGGIYTGKLYFIDDMEYRTFLKAEEY